MLGKPSPSAAEAGRRPEPVGGAGRTARRRASAGSVEKFVLEALPGIRPFQYRKRLYKTFPCQSLASEVSRAFIPPCIRADVSRRGNRSRTEHIQRDAGTLAINSTIFLGPAFFLVKQRPIWGCASFYLSCLRFERAAAGIRIRRQRAARSSTPRTHARRNDAPGLCRCGVFYQGPTTAFETGPSTRSMTLPGPRIGQPRPTGFMPRPCTYLANFLDTSARNRGMGQHRFGAEALKFQNVVRCQ
ncbi:hypothetical protein J2W76_002834 [Methylorubrum zatmanii]|nr:hypothetical protein [Methylorubrum zatmanii]MCP1553797.1 hypothetical protein [Methylorubrum extorquens]MCP1579891.1 hypothetical protein [Methylorubrum extorquens]